MNNMPAIVAADGHLHVYPAYDLRALFRNLAQNLDRLALAAGPAGPGKEVHRLAFLAEGREHDFFSRLQDRDPALAGQGLEIASGADPVCVTVAVHGAGRVSLAAGRQIVTRERLEILGLAMRAKVPDGLPARDAIQEIVAVGGIPVLAWAPGKWLFARGRLARDLINKDPGKVLRLGDTTLRPSLWPAPRLMRLAREQGRAVIPGSDPLPFAGEEHYAGAYGFIYQGAFDAAQPAASIRRMLSGPASAITPSGARCGAWDVARRLKHLRATRRST